MPGFELVGKEERDAVDEVVTQSYMWRLKRV